MKSKSKLTLIEWKPQLKSDFCSLKNDPEIGLHGIVEIKRKKVGEMKVKIMIPPRPLPLPLQMGS